MKTYTVKNYKGNLVESLKKFSDSHKDMKIVEAIENGDNLKIKVKESEEKQITESTGKFVYVLRSVEEDSDGTVEAIFSTKENAEKGAAEWHKINGDSENDSVDLVIQEIELDNLNAFEDSFKEFSA